MLQSVGSQRVRHDVAMEQQEVRKSLWNKNHLLRTNLLLFYCCLLATKLCPTLYDPIDCSPQAPLSMEFPRQEYWSGSKFPSPGDFLNPGIEPTSPVLAGGFFTTEPPGKPKGRLENVIEILCLDPLSN